MILMQLTIYGYHSTNTQRNDYYLHFIMNFANSGSYVQRYTFNVKR